VIRSEAGLTVRRFCELVGVPRRTYQRWKMASEQAPGVKGPWPAPVRDRTWQPAAQLALEWPAWGHRKIHALLAVDGFHASQATVRRALARRGLPQPVGYQRERRELAKARKAAFVSAPSRRNRVWQTDFSELETAAGGTWQMSGVVDYVAKLALCCPVTTTKTWRDAVAALEDARGSVEDLLGVSLLQDCTSPYTGALTPVIVISDNGPCYRAAGFARYIASRPELSHVRTRHRSPGTNGVIERFYESLKYEHLYRHEIDDGLALDEHVGCFLDVYNRKRPHEALQFALPIDRYLAVPTDDQSTTEEPNPQTT
jgi:transposase InsO family protein